MDVCDVDVEHVEPETRADSASSFSTRVLRLTSLLHGVALGAVVVVTVFSWMLRLWDDLRWDEALNFKAYARHPVTALALYHEPNNHPLESLWKSFFYFGLGFDDPTTWRFPAFLLALTYLGIVGLIARELLRRGGALAATATVVLLLHAWGIHAQVMVMRGYFMTSLLLTMILLVVVRRGRLLDAGRDREASPPFSSSSWRYLTLVGGLFALVLFTVPSNVLVVVPLLVTTSFAMTMPSEDRSYARGVVRTFLRMTTITTGLALLLWTPILVGLVTGVSRFHGVPHAVPVDRFANYLRDVEHIIANARPFEVPSAMMFLVGAGLLAVVGTLSSPYRRLAAWALLTAVLVPLMSAAAGLVSVFPSRTRDPFVVPVTFAVAMIAFAATARLPKLLQHVGAIGLLAYSLVAPDVFPFMMRGDPLVYPHEVQESATLLAAVTRPDRQDVVIVHDYLEPLRPYLHRTMGRARVVDGRAEMRQRVLGEPRAPWRQGSGKLGVWRDRILPEEPPPPGIVPDDVDVLVLVEDDWRVEFMSGPLTWDEEGFVAWWKSFPKRREVRHGRYLFIVLEK